MAEIRTRDKFRMSSFQFVPEVHFLVWDIPQPELPVEGAAQEIPGEKRQFSVEDYVQLVRPVPRITRQNSAQCKIPD